ncbi:hypothetical protein TSIB_1430 [Thermococcus sibiricus MM 739]|uniref:Uncharacterized protein n=1 Tax=Thermococcus sibiricus (strain DSM 12597 / MM 739) TaxID=604354 RepID=C6A4D6_THESM|nr:hypothetical protein TSIB_1430 [Thermococcus sibiricus MM 739]
MHGETFNFIEVFLFREQVIVFTFKVAEKMFWRTGRDLNPGPSA